MKVQAPRASFTESHCGRVVIFQPTIRGTQEIVNPVRVFVASSEKRQLSGQDSRAELQVRRRNVFRVVS